MFCDVFDRNEAMNLLKGKRIWFFGSSNMRAIYKDFLWLVTNGNLATMNAFKVKNEPTFLGDKLISNDVLHNGRNYKETRICRKGNTVFFFHFLTRLFLDDFIQIISQIKPDTSPDVIFINSCLWDLSRWGPDGHKDYRTNMLRTFKFLKNKLSPNTRVVWKTGLPVSTAADGAIFIDEIKFIVPMLPWHILEANQYAATCANFFNYDTLDVHHHMRLQGHLRVKDGIHWQPVAIRYMTNLFLTHLSLCWNTKLPGRFSIPGMYLKKSTRIIKEPALKDRIENKEGFFNKLFKIGEKVVNKAQHLRGITNKVLHKSKNIFKRKFITKRNRRSYNFNHQKENRNYVYDSFRSADLYIPYNNNERSYYQQYNHPYKSRW